MNRGPAYATGYSTYSAGVWFNQYVAPRYESQRQRTQIRTEERVIGAQSALDIVQDIENATGKVRRAMSEKYQIEF